MEIPVDLQGDQLEVAQILVWIKQYLSEKRELSQQEVLTEIFPRLNRAIELSDKGLLGDYPTLLEIRAKAYEFLGMHEEAKEDQQRAAEHPKHAVDEALAGYIQAMQQPSTYRVSNAPAVDVTSGRGYGARPRSSS